MPHGSTKFKEAWLDKTDGNGHRIGDWLTKDQTSEYSAKCILCASNIKCDNAGLPQIYTHAKGKARTEKAKARFSKNQAQFGNQSHLVALQSVTMILSHRQKLHGP